MANTQFLPAKLRQTVDRELKAGEVIRWIEQPIARLFTRATTSIFVAGLLSLGFFGYFTYHWWKLPSSQSSDFASMGNFVQVGGLLVGGLCLMISCVPLAVPFLSWQAARQTVYLITDQRALIVQGGWKTTIRSFNPNQLQDTYRTERAKGIGDVIIAVRHWIDSEGDAQREEIGFMDIRNPKAVEELLRSPK
ncbi:MAG TPA: hypothetical protein V6D29_01190 [Leptolyngbyaceae cyanobacterium]